MTDHGELQLLSETKKKISIKVPGENRLIYIGGILLALALGLGFGISWYRASLERQLTDVDDQIVALEAQRHKENEQKLLIFSKQVAQVSNVLADHLFWSHAFSKLEVLLTPQVQIMNLSANTQDNTFHLAGRAASYTLLARQITAFFSDAAVKDVTVSQISTLSDGKLDFTLDVEFNPEKFLH